MISNISFNVVMNKMIKQTPYNKTKRVVTDNAAYIVHSVFQNSKREQGRKSTRCEDKDRK